MDGTISREELILSLVETIASAENKVLGSPEGDPAHASREYILSLIREVLAALDGKRAGAND